MRESRLRQLDVDVVLGEDIVCFVDHLVAVLLRHLLTVRIYRRFETVLFPWERSLFFGNICEEPVAEKEVEVVMQFATVVLLNYEHTVDLVIVEVDAVYSTDCEQENINIDLSDTVLFQEIVAVFE